MAAGRTVVVNARELRDAFDFVSAGEAFDHSAYISLDTGKIYRKSTEAGLEEDDLPDDIDDSDRYLAVPDQRDLDLGRRLATPLDAPPSRRPSPTGSSARLVRSPDWYVHPRHLRGRNGDKQARQGVAEQDAGSDAQRQPDRKTLFERTYRGRAGGRLQLRRMAMSRSAVVATAPTGAVTPYGMPSSGPKATNAAPASAASA